MKNSLLWFCRIFVGTLFIFSGLVKANDPVGFGIKLDEYYEVFAETWPWTSFLFKAAWVLNTTTLQAAFLTTLEVVLGIALLLGIKKNLVSWLLLLLILFFTWLTGFTAVTGTPSDCGCFGDAIPLTALQSFYKDIILTIFILVIFFMRKNIKPAFSPVANSVVFVLVSAFAIWVNVHVIRHDVFIDFRPYAIGKNIQAQMVAPADAPKGKIRMDYVYENTSSGKQETVSIMSDHADYSLLSKYSDSTQWKFVERKHKVLEKAYLPKTSAFSIQDGGRNITNRILNNPDVVFMIIAQDFDHTSEDGWIAINALQKAAEKEGVFTFALAGEGTNDIDQFRHEHQAAFPFYPGDAKVCLTIARVNPSVVLLREGTVIGKWSWRDLPSYEEIKSEYFADRTPTELMVISDDMFAVNENVGSMIEKSEEPYNEFYLQDTVGDDATSMLMNDTSLVYMLIVNETSSDKLSADKWKPVGAMLHQMDSMQVNYFVVSSAPVAVLFQMEKFSGVDFDFYTSDKDVLHKIMKENAGLVIIKNGVVIKKYTEANWPTGDAYLKN